MFVRNNFKKLAFFSREPQQQSKKLWDKSEVDRWQHDMYNEADQGPKEEWEIKVESTVCLQKDKKICSVSFLLVKIEILA